MVIGKNLWEWIFISRMYKKHLTIRARGLVASLDILSGTCRDGMIGTKYGKLNTMNVPDLLTLQKSMQSAMMRTLIPWLKMVNGLIAKNKTSLWLE